MEAKGQNEVTVVFMGNSIIEGWKQADPDFFSDPKLLNKGIGGQTTPQMLSRFEKDVLDPVDGQLFFSQTGGGVQILEYRQGEQPQQ